MTEPQNHISFMPGDDPIDVTIEGRCKDVNTFVVRLRPSGDQVAVTFNGTVSSSYAMRKVLAGKSYRISYGLKVTEAHTWDQLTFMEIE
jgi:hypothetical protein